MEEFISFGTGARVRKMSLDIIHRLFWRLFPLLPFCQIMQGGGLQNTIYGYFQVFP
jgi:hypothetical protein